MSCVLRVLSSDNLDGFVSSGALPICSTHVKGSASPGGKRRPYESHGLVCDVSAREFEDLAGQISDAFEFIKRYDAELRSLRSCHRIEDMRLDFAYCARASEMNLAQFDYLPPAFLRCAADLGIGIELSLYSVANDKNA